MIRLEVEEYCQDCLDFLPDIKRPARAEDFCGEDVVLGDTYVRCSNRKRCEAIKRYLALKLRSIAETDWKSIEKEDNKDA